MRNQFSDALEPERLGGNLITADGYHAALQPWRQRARVTVGREAGQLIFEPLEVANEPDLIAAHLDTAGIPDPDLLIRTSGEMRVSNFLLWQISYAEMVIVKKFWPEFRQGELFEAVNEYKRRHRRFGAL